MIVTDLCMPAKPTSKSWSCDVATPFQERAEAVAEAFYNLLRASVMVQKLQFLIDPPGTINFKSAWGSRLKPQDAVSAVWGHKSRH